MDSQDYNAEECNKYVQHITFNININTLILNDPTCKSGSVVYTDPNLTSHRCSYTDVQVAQALNNIVGKGKAIDSKSKWAGAVWLLHWLCNYPVNTKDACERINQLPLREDLEYKCDYRNIRELATLSFMNEDARDLDNVKYHKGDEAVFFKMKKVVLALGQELKKIAIINDIL